MSNGCMPQTHVYLHVVQPLLEERQHLRQFIVRVHVVDGAAALLQQPDDVLVLDLLVHFELLESGAQRLEKGAEVAVVREVGLRKLHGDRVDRDERL